MKRSKQTEKKLAVLLKIKEAKDILFGSFKGNVITKVEKENKWGEILCEAKRVGLADDSKDWKYCRDSMFGMWKSRTLAKTDNAKTTGSAGGKKNVLDEADNLILDIISKESPIVEGLKEVPESTPSSSCTPAEVESVASDPKTTTQKSGQKSGKRQHSNTGERSLQDERKAKIACLEADLYYRTLKCYCLEVKNGLPPSTITKDLYDSIKKNKKRAAEGNAMEAVETVEEAEGNAMDAVETAKEAVENAMEAVETAN